MPLPTVLLDRAGTVVALSRSAEPRHLPDGCVEGACLPDLLGGDDHGLRHRMERALRSTVPQTAPLIVGGALRPFRLSGLRHGDSYLILQADPETASLGDRLVHRREAARLKTSLRISENQRLRLESEAERLEYAAHRDGRTGLYNAMAFERMVGAALRGHDPRGVMVYLDLDGFKKVNDRHGHAAGDAVLAVVAQRLCDAVRDTDIVARLGGDEFAVWLKPGTAAFDPAVPERIAASIRPPIPLQSAASGDITVCVGVSLGIARAPEDTTDVESLIRIANSRMYLDKRAAAVRGPRQSRRA
ncbi:GGDEF domain-containing protein [Pseudoruegeria sp. HB172150]|uniref:GGDEF domain-containing protein n=1 Tax=Pseudoruegeria sp. HB172150 TaxID=2721164 RepID=UPI0027389C58|nr:GGDEF domain-containing protein [Pseudoruegeria sp. HB172150]